MTFEIHSKAKLNLIQNHLNSNFKLEDHTKTSKWKDTVKLLKLEIAKFDGDPTKWQPGLGKFYDDVESNVRSLRNLGIDSKSYGSLLSTLIFQKHPKDIKLTISRKIETDIWNLTKVFDLICLEL